MTGNQQVMTSSALSNVNPAGRVEITDPNAFNLHLSDAAVQQIRRLEESVLTAEERLGYFRVG